MNANINGLDIYYESHGDGPPVLLIHGFPLSNELWTPLIERMGGDYRLIAPDLRGHGRSQAAPAASMAECADDLAALLDAVGESSAVIVGLSMGGYVAMDFCRRHADRVDAVVLSDTRAEPDTPEAAADRRALADRVLAEGSHIVADAMVKKLFAPNASNELKEQWRKIMAATPPKGVAAALCGMADRSDSFDVLRSLNKPALVIVGEHDAITPPSAARAMHAALPNGKIQIITEAGHMPPVETPDRFAFILKRFLDELN